MSSPVSMPFNLKPANNSISNCLLMLLQFTRAPLYMISKRTFFWNNNVLCKGVIQRFKVQTFKKAVSLYLETSLTA
ncbi:hypothetical protein AQUCO_00201039v1 [Aquilegia coerulea]|uniref:Uncharacterized protein n=1 Tax=Aquilegia coerulea TaxID=218851 RepID=A0A2G5F602_AQUCA|nr:hypothetical protein AQUCO_00201039v1 [Aquilegia coerulea]